MPQADPGGGCWLYTIMNFSFMEQVWATPRTGSSLYHEEVSVLRINPSEVLPIDPGQNAYTCST